MSRIMAHRGARNLWAENSMMGFRNILPHGFDAVEFDVHLTDAGEMVVIHDATLERTTNGAGSVRALTPEARRTLRLKGPDGQFIDECPPLLEEVLALFAEDPSIELWIELKSDADGKPYAGLVEKAAAAIHAAGLDDRSAMHSFDISVVEQVRAVAPVLLRLVSVDARSAAAYGGLPAFLDRVSDLVDIVGIHHELFEAEYALIANTIGVKRASVWTINTPQLMQHWITRAPGFLVSDDPVQLKALMTQEAAA